MLDDDELDALIEGTYDAPEIMLGDIILAFGICKAEAAEIATIDTVISNWQTAISRPGQE